VDPVVAAKAAEVFEAARKNALGTPPRKHHLVPASYLGRWAEDGQVRVTVIDEPRTYTVAPDKAARETDFYSLKHDALDPDVMPPLLMETVLGTLEGSAVAASDVLVGAAPETLDVEARAEMAMFLAFQFTRGRSFREGQRHMLADAYRLLYAGYDDAAIRRHLEDRGVVVTPAVLDENRAFLRGLASGEIEMRRAQPQEIALAAGAARTIAEHLWTRRWVVYQASPTLITCDDPVVPIGGPGSPRGQRAGVATAGVIIYPLSPSRLLAMFAPSAQVAAPLRLDAIEVADINREILGATDRWAFETPSRLITMRMQVPGPVESFTREGPLPQDHLGSGDLYVHYKRTRWSRQHPPPPWPVSRWWR